MPNLTTNFDFNLPLVNNATDADLWGGQLNSNWTSLDGILPVPAASKYGAVVVQSTSDAAFEILSGQGTSGQFLKSAGADALPVFSDLTAATTSAAGVAELATAAEMVTGTDANRVPSVSVVKNHSGVAKAWVLFNGTGTPSIRASYNVSSITDSGGGLYVVNFSTAFSSANYAVCGWARVANGGSNISAFVGGQTGQANQTASACPIAVWSDVGSNVDVEYVSVIFFGDQ